MSGRVVMLLGRSEEWEDWLTAKPCRFASLNSSGRTRPALPDDARNSLDRDSLGQPRVRGTLSNDNRRTEMFLAHYWSSRHGRVRWAAGRCMACAII